MWSFIQNEVLGMAWLKRLVYGAFSSAGMDTSAGLGGSLSFFVYDVIKISILLGVLIFGISYIQSYFPPERSRSILGSRKGIKASVTAALLGTLTPFCSCSSIPIFMGFTAAGLPLSTSFSFLISSPMVDLGSLMLLTGIFGWKIAAVYVVFGLVIAVAGGSLIGALDMEDQVEDFIRAAGIVSQSGSDGPDAGDSQSRDGKAAEYPQLSASERIEYARDQVESTFRRVFPYMLAGVALGSLIHNCIPQSLVLSLLGSGSPLGVILAVLCGIPMYADIFGTVPIAEALLAKGAALGVVLSFMMAVTTLSLPSLVMLGKVIKKRLLISFTAICTVGIIAAGYVFNMLQGLIM